MIVGFNSVPLMRAKQITMIVLIIANKKLLAGDRITLEIAMGKKKANDDLPLES